MRRIKTREPLDPVGRRALHQRELHAVAAQQHAAQVAAAADGEYARQGSEDDRFVDYFGTIQSIVTSSGNNDSGMFETNLRDERSCRSKGAGAESTWRLELPASFRQFDYDTISDVILHMRYTARQGGAQLRDEGGRAH